MKKKEERDYNDVVKFRDGFWLGLVIGGLIGMGKEKDEERKGKGKGDTEYVRNIMLILLPMCSSHSTLTPLCNGQITGGSKWRSQSCTL